MSRSTRIYILILLAFGSGLWLILSTGNRFLVAPVDLSGTWTLRPAGVPADAGKPASLVVQQSGRYVNVRGTGKPQSLVLEAARLSGPAGSQTIAMSGAGERLLWTQIPGKPDFVISGSSVVPGDWHATREPNGR